MSSSTSSSELRGSRAFLATLVLLVLATEAAFATLSRENRGRHEVDDCAYLVEARPAPIRSVLLSDSVSYGVLDGVELPPDVLDLSSNQAIGLAGNHFLMQRLFARLAAQGAEAPRFVVLAMNPVSFSSNLDSRRFLEPYFASVFLRPAEIADVEASLDRPDVVGLQRKAAFAHALQLPSYLRRGLVHLPLRDGLRAMKRWLQSETGTANEAPGGAHLWAEAARANLEERSQRSFVVSEVTAAYLPKLLELCAANDTVLVVVPSPLPPTVRTAWRESGFWEAYRAWLAELSQRHPALRTLPECPYQAPDDALFYDGIHLTQTGKNAWAAALEALLASPRDALGAAADSSSSEH